MKHSLIIFCVFYLLLECIKSELIGGKDDDVWMDYFTAGQHRNASEEKIKEIRAKVKAFVKKNSSSTTASITMTTESEIFKPVSIAKKAKTVTAKVDDEEPSWLLEKMKFVKVREFRGAVMVDIREYYEDKSSGELKPGKKGISLSMAQWKKLVNIIPEIEETVKNKT